MLYVPSHGPPDARIVLCGEGPASQEEQEGKPFVGWSGQELNRMLNDGGILRSECFAMNISRFRAPNNQMNRWVYKPTKTQLKEGPPPGFVEWRGHYVKDHIPGHFAEVLVELGAVRPNVVIAFGEIAMWALTDKKGIGKWRGSELTCPFLSPTVKVIPTYHPSFIIRGAWPKRYDAVQDIRRAKREAGYPELRRSDWISEIGPSFQRVMSLLDNLINDANLNPGRWLVCDIETRQKQIACVGLAYMRDKAICIPFRDPRQPEGYFSFEEEVAIIWKLRELLTHPNVYVINQNYLYDAFYMAFLWGFLSIASFDTMIAQNVIFPGKEKDLGFLSSLYCDHHAYWKDEGKEWNPKVPPEDLWRYNCEDCLRTWEVAEEQHKVLKAYNLWQPFLHEMALFRPVLKAMLRGINTDPTVRDEMSKEIKKAMATSLGKLKQIFGHDVNPRSPQQLQKLFYEDLGIKPLLSRKTMRPTVDHEALERLKRMEPLLTIPVNEIEKYRTMGIFRSNFLEAEGPRNRMYTSLNIAGTESMRFSSSENPLGWGTNLQNVPRREPDEPVDPDLPDIRKIFLPDQHRGLVEADLTKADLHVVVWEADDEELKQMLAEGVNIYREEGCKVTGMPYTKAKSFIHGTNYGGKARTMAVACGITIHQSETIQKKWFAAHPGIQEWHRRTVRSLENTRSVSNAFGFRRLYFEKVEEVLPEALAWVPQSTVANVINKALLALEPYAALAELLLQVHDSLLHQYLLTERARFIEIARKVFANIIVPYPRPLVIPVEFKVSEASWAEVKAME